MLLIFAKRWSVLMLRRVCAVHRHSTRQSRNIPLHHAMQASGACQLFAVSHWMRTKRHPGSRMHRDCDALLRLGCAVLCRRSGDPATSCRRWKTAWRSTSSALSAAATSADQSFVLLHIHAWQQPLP